MVNQPTPQDPTEDSVFNRPRLLLRIRNRRRCGASGRRAGAQRRRARSGGHAGPWRTCGGSSGAGGAHAAAVIFGDGGAGGTQAAAVMVGGAGALTRRRAMAGQGSVTTAMASKRRHATRMS